MTVFLFTVAVVVVAVVVVVVVVVAGRRAELRADDGRICKRQFYQYNSSTFTIPPSHSSIVTAEL